MSWWEGIYDDLLRRGEAVGWQALPGLVRTWLGQRRERNLEWLRGRRSEWAGQSAKVVEPIWCHRPEILGLPWVRSLLQVAGTDPRADAVLAGKLLGFELPSPGADFPWTRGPEAGPDFGVAGVLRILAPLPAEEGPLRALREAGRLQAATLLAARSRIEGRPEEGQRAMDLVAGFLATVQPGCAIHWLRTEDVALRLASLVWVLTLLGPGEAERRFESLLAVAIHRHQCFLAERLPEAVPGSFAATSGWAVQFAVSAGLPWFEASEEWRISAQEGFERSVDRGTFQDGVGRIQDADAEFAQFEAMLLAIRVADRSGLELSPAARARIERVAEYLAASRLGCETSGRTGSCEAGFSVLLPLGEGGRARSVLAAAALVFDRPDLARLAGTLDAQSLLLAGDRDSGSRWEKWTGTTLVEPLLAAEAFPEGGRYFFRSSQGPRLVLGFDAGSHGREPEGIGCHADLLSVTLTVGARPVIVDPGDTLVDRPEGIREYLRGTGAHSTVRLDWRSSSWPGPSGRWDRLARPLDRGYAVDSSGRLLMATAAHDGFGETSRAVMHRRTITRDHGNSLHLAIEDEVFGEAPGPVDFELLFHFDPGIPAILKLRDIYQVACGDTTLCFRFSSETSLEVAATRGHERPLLGWYARDLGGVEACWVLRAFVSARLPIKVRTAIFPT